MQRVNDQLGAVARPARVRFVTVRDDNTRALRLRAGAASLAQGVIPPILLPLLERLIPGITDAGVAVAGALARPAGRGWSQATSRKSTSRRGRPGGSRRTGLIP